MKGLCAGDQVINFQQIIYNIIYQWMRLSILWRIMEIEEGVIRRGRTPRRITPSEISIIVHMIRKPNSIIVLLFFQKPLFRLVPAAVLNLETSEVSAILVFRTKTTQPRPQVFSVNGVLTCKRLHFWRHFLLKDKILPNLVISKCFW